MTRSRRHWIIVLGVGTVAGLVFVGCQSGGQHAETQASPEQGTAETSLALTAVEDQPAAVAAGARLWQQNCIRCHNPRAPASLSDSQWRVVMHHMRVRANLTADEHESILRFLQAAN